MYYSKWGRIKFAVLEFFYVNNVQIQVTRCKIYYIINHLYPYFLTRQQSLVIHCRSEIVLAMEGLVK